MDSAEKAPRTGRQRRPALAGVAVAAMLSAGCGLSSTSASTAHRTSGRTSVGGGSAHSAVPAAGALRAPTDPASSSTTTTLELPPASVGKWATTAGSASHPAVSTAQIVINASPSNATVTAMRIDPGLVQMNLIPGTEQPVAAPAAGIVPAGDRNTLIAAFNAGFKMKDTNGGWFSQGRTAVPLAAGVASLVVRSNGTADVGMWGRDDTMDATVTAVRQNRLLLIDNRVPNPLVTTPYFRFVWGATIHKQEAVWRSGIGITKNGLLVYAAGPSLTVPQLTAALLAVGAVRAMELDINTQFVDAYTYTPSATGPIGAKLVPSMRYGPDHYLNPQPRDFVEVLSR